MSHSANEALCDKISRHPFVDHVCKDPFFRRPCHVNSNSRRLGRVMEESNTITEEEAEQYDRQIRLWGVEAQKKCGTFISNVHNVSCLFSCAACA